jgi:hypothetical protein
MATERLKKVEIIDTEQKIYDGFNDFILSPDTKVFGKLLARTLLLNEIKDIPGDIVECGVFKATGLLSFLKLKNYLMPNTHKKVIGFDFFESAALVDSLSGQDKELMDSLFSDRGVSHDKDFCELLKQKILSFGFKPHEFDLVKGDASKTTFDYLKDKPGLKISLLYMDVDIEKPTFDILEALWDRVSRGGLVVFDEYAFQSWSESRGADRFFKDKNVVIKSLNYICPTAYIKKA